MKMTVAKKIMAGFGVLLVFIGVVGAMSLNKMSLINQNVEDIYEKHVIGIGLIKQANVELIKRGRAEKNMLLAETPAEREKHATATVKFAASFNKELNAFGATLVTAEGKAKVKEIGNLWQSLEPIQDSIINYANQGKIAEAVASAKQGRSVVDQIEERITFLSNQKSELAQEEYRQSSLIYNQSWTLIIGIILVSILLGFGIAVYISRLIVKPVSALAAAAVKIANGDLTIDEVKIKSRDEIRTLADSFNTMANNLKDMILQINSTSHSVSATSEELSANAGEAAKATQQVARAIEQVAQGSTEQTRSITDTVEVVEQVSQAI